MSDLTMIEINCETGETIERPLTAEELAAHDAAIANVEAERIAREAAEAEALAAKESAQAKLAALGLTAAEIAALSK